MTYNPKSLENLKLGAESRKSGKERHAFTIKPTSYKWLSSGGNASLRLDEMVDKLIAGELIGIQHLRKLQARIEALEKELAVERARLAEKSK